ncbi:TfoX/Sxy family protein [bacterium]|nr:TfoX/Sxy family protein [bacterium]
MASTRDYLEYVLEQLQLVPEITSRPMMGEYLFYYQGVLFGGVYDNRLLVKKVPSNTKYELEEAIPYPNGKPMWLVDFEDQELLRDLVQDTYADLIQKEK